MDRNFQRHADLVGIARHLDRGIDVEDFAPGIPARHHAEGLDRHGRGAAPFHPQRELARAGGEILVDLAPDEGLVEQHIRAVRLVHQRARPFQRLFGVEHEGQRLVIDFDGFGGVLGQRARIGDHGGDPFAGVARDIERQRPARHFRVIEPGHQRQRSGGQLCAVDDVMHAGHFQRSTFVDALDARGGVRAGHERDMLGIRQIDIGDEISLAGDETPVLAHAAVARNVAVTAGLVHLVRLRGRLTPRMRSAASAIASTICA